MRVFLLAMFVVACLLLGACGSDAGNGGGASATGSGGSSGAASTSGSSTSSSGGSGNPGGSSSGSSSSSGSGGSSSGGSSSSGASAVSTIYSFGTGPAGTADGARPNGSLIQGSDGYLYGTTRENVGTDVNGGPGAHGVIFKLTLAGEETIIQSGTNSESGLILGSDSNFYGVAQSPELQVISSTQFSCGSVYQLTPAGVMTTLYTFAFTNPEGCFDNLNPGLISGGSGILYGSNTGYNTDDGEAPSMLFSLTLAGAVSALSSLPVGQLQEAAAGLTLGSDGNIYEITSAGGAHNAGSIYKVTPAGQATLLYSFGAFSGDGILTSNQENSAPPVAALLWGPDGNFYGVTPFGGATGCGTVFKLTPAGVETVLHSFCSTAQDAQTPSGPLILAKDGSFYGLASGTISFGSCMQVACGSVYRMTPDGTVSVIYTFSGPDGQNPVGSLLQASDGNLYGTTVAGGALNAGIVFRVALGAH
jgi:uncharacterized repeat protein (TIGR03803 family)